MLPSDYESWQLEVLKNYNNNNDTNYSIGDIEICEDGSVYEGNLSFDSGYITWPEYQSYC
jgi:hypothetical protein